MTTDERIRRASLDALSELDQVRQRGGLSEAQRAHLTALRIHVISYVLAKPAA